MTRRHGNIFLWRLFHSYGDVPITGEGLLMLTYPRNPWTLSSEGSLACHTFYDTEYTVMCSSAWTRDTRTCWQAFGSSAITTCFSATAFESRISRMRSTNRGNAEVDVNDYRQVCMGLCFFVIKMDYYYFYLNFFNAKKNKQEAHGPHRSPEKRIQINKHI